MSHFAGLASYTNFIWSATRGKERRPWGSLVILCSSTTVTWSAYRSTPRLKLAWDKPFRPRVGSSLPTRSPFKPNLFVLRSDLSDQCSDLSDLLFDLSQLQPSQPRILSD